MKPKKNFERKHAKEIEHKICNTCDLTNSYLRLNKHL